MNHSIGLSPLKTYNASFIMLIHDNRSYWINLNNICYIKQIKVIQGWNNNNKESIAYEIHMVNNDIITLTTEEFNSIKDMFDHIRL